MLDEYEERMGLGYQVGHYITSGYRCAVHNAKVGGVPNSFHTQGKAIDLYVGASTLLQYDLTKALHAARHVGFKRLGWKQYKGKFIHLDVGNYPKRGEW